MKHVTMIIGTRPEAIKMAPVYLALKKQPELRVSLISSGQHREILHQSLEAFGIRADLDLSVMAPGQSLSQTTAKILAGLDEVLRIQRPDLIMGHGDTSTCFAAALASFFLQVPFHHVEAGLRSYRLDSPFPEEFNRQSVSQIASHHFAPSEKAAHALRGEGIDPRNITHTGGSTVIDAMRSFKIQSSARARPLPEELNNSKQTLLLTLHRRELSTSHCLGEYLQVIRAHLRIYRRTRLVFPLHPNPLVRRLAQSIFKGMSNVELCEPLPYREFMGRLAHASLVLTDSGGVQEEAALMGKKTLLLRNATERDDGLEGDTRLVGQSPLHLDEALGRALQELRRDPPPTRLRELPQGSPSQRIASRVAVELAAS